MTPKAATQKKTASVKKQVAHPKKRTTINAALREEIRAELDSFSLRFQSVNEFTRRTNDAENLIDNLVAATIKESTRAYRISNIIYHIGSSLCFLMVGTGLFFAIAQKTLSAEEIGLIAAGVLLFVFLQTQNPIQKSPHFTDHVASIGAIYKAYLMQINQIDRNFKNYLARTTEIDASQTNEYLRQLQDALDSLILGITNKNQGI